MQTKIFKTALLISVSVGLLSSCDSNNQTAPSERYEYKHNGSVVLDKVEKLEWMRCALGEIWNNALSICEGKSVGVSFELLDGVSSVINSGQSVINVSGDSDWRMPSIQELRSLRYCSELSAAEMSYLSEQENKELKKSLRKFADLQIVGIERTEATINDIKTEGQFVVDELNVEIAAFQAQLISLDKQLEIDLSKIKSETQQEKDEATSKKIELELALQKFEDKYTAQLAIMQEGVDLNAQDKITEKSEHKSTISGVKSEFSEKLKKVRKLTKNIVSNKAKKTTSKIKKLQLRHDQLLALVEFFETVYVKDRSEIANISTEVKQLKEMAAELADFYAQENKDIEDLEREVANTTNPEIVKLFESEKALTSIKRRYFLNEKSLKAKMKDFTAEYLKEYEVLEETFKISKMQKADQYDYIVTKAKKEINIKLVSAEESLLKANIDTKRRVKTELHSILKDNIVIDTFLEILEIESLDVLDEYLATDVITDMKNIVRLEDEILNSFNLYPARVSSLQGTFPGKNDIVREPCGYLSRSPVRRYEDSDVKSNLTEGVWMLDKEAFPTTEKTRGNFVTKTNGVFFWSGSELGYNELFGWGVNFKDGRSKSTDKGFAGRIRLVRDAD